MTRYKRVVILLIDGLSTATLDDMLSRGVLPQLSKLVQKGTYKQEVVASFPTVTGPAHVPLLSGKHPSTLDLIGHNQYVRREGRFENYLLHYNHLTRAFGNGHTLYNDFTDSVSVNEPFRVGAHHYRRNLFALSDWARIRGPANGYVLRRVQNEYKNGRDLIVGWLHETDGFAHMSPRERHVEACLIQLDRWLAKFTAQISDDTLIALCSDHGMERTNGKPVFLRPVMAKAGFSRRTAKLYLDGGAFGQMYFRKNNSYKERASETDLNGLPELLAKTDGVGLVLHRRTTDTSTRVVITSRTGIASCECATKGAASYRVESGRDPLANDTQAGDRTTYPDAARQIALLMTAPSSGDLIVTGGPKTTFNILTRYAVHGGLRRQQSVTFFLFNRPLDLSEAGLGPQRQLHTSDLPGIVRSVVSSRA